MYVCVCGDSETEMKRYSKKCQKTRATEEMRLSLYCVLGNEYDCRDTEMPANALSPPSSHTSGCYRYDEMAEAGRRRLRSSDLESEFFGTEISTSIGVNFRREEICRDSRRQFMATEKQNLSLQATASPQKKTPAYVATAPSAVELEEFFTEAEGYVQKRFAEKYNFDIMKDAPILEGRYQWVSTPI